MNTQEEDDSDIIPGMDQSQSESFVIAVQAMVYEMKGGLAERVQAEEHALKLYQEAQRAREWHQEKLAAVLQFLSIYNKDAHEDWFAAVGMDHLKQQPNTPNGSTR